MIRLGMEHGAKVQNKQNLKTGSRFNLMSCYIIFRFPKDLSKTLSDESELRKRIELAISGARGIRGNFNTPQVAFESVTRQEIALYEKPICECVDSVVDLLKRIVRRCIEPVSY